MAEDLDRQVAREKEKINSMYELFLRHYKLDKKKFRPNGLYKKASLLRPKRLFKGPLPGNYLRENLDEKHYSWHENYIEKADWNYGSKTFEIVNLSNGKRTLLDIRHVISCEYDEIDIEFVLHFAEDLKKLGLIAFN